MTIQPSSNTTITQTDSTSWLSSTELHTLEKFCETFFPQLDPPAASTELHRTYYQRSANDLQLANLIAEQVALENAEAQSDFRRLLTALMNPITGLLLIGKPRSFVALDQEEREKYVLALANSPLGPFRQGFQTVKRLAWLPLFRYSRRSGYQSQLGGTKL